MKAGEAIEKEAPAINRKTGATVAPLRFDEEWRTRDVTLLDPLAAAVFELNATQAATGHADRLPGDRG